MRYADSQGVDMCLASVWLLKEERMQKWLASSSLPLCWTSHVAVEQRPLHPFGEVFGLRRPAMLEPPWHSIWACPWYFSSFRGSSCTSISASLGDVTSERPHVRQQGNGRQHRMGFIRWRLGKLQSVSWTSLPV